MATKTFSNMRFYIDDNHVLSISTWTFERTGGHFAKASVAVLDEFNQFVGDVDEFTRVSNGTYAQLEKAKSDVRYAAVAYGSKRVSEILGHPTPVRFFRDNEIKRYNRNKAKGGQ